MLLAHQNSADLFMHRVELAAYPKIYSKVIGFFGRHAGENRHLEFIEIPGFRVALAIASLPGMTIEVCHELLRPLARYTCR
jgi:hypothetical protein